MHYRPDVDGLRATAVAAVVLYHADHRWLPGGFTGVDVFFVISGYLIAKQMAVEIENGTFSLARFYERRARRILPALVAVLLASTLAATIWLLPSELIRYGNSLIATSVFASNIYFWRTTGYFSAPPDSTPLLHLWSLAVEEQFYLFFPLLPVLLRHASRRARGHLIWAVLLGSLVVAEWGAQARPDAAFYLGPTRAWELLCGVALAFRLVPQIHDRLSAEVMAALGVGSILLGLLLLTQESQFPGVSALLPCLGAALVIHSGESRRTFVSRALALPGLVFIGLISYSLYLWHWVILVFARHIAMRELGATELLGLIALSVLISCWSWHFIEQPFRRQGRSTAAGAALAPGKALWSAVAASGFLLASGSAIVASEGLTSRYESSALLYADGQRRIWERREECDGRVCEGAAGGQPRGTVMLWGDSHAAALAPAFLDLAAASGWQGLVAYQRSCPPLIGYRNFARRARDCGPFIEEILRVVDDRRVSRVFLHARWPWYVEGTSSENSKIPDIRLSPGQFDTKENSRVFTDMMRQTLHELAMRGVSVTIVSSVPEVGVDAPRLLARRAQEGAPLPYIDEARFDARAARAHAAIETALGEHPKADLLHLFPRMCSVGRCSIAHEGRALYHDSNHLSTDGAQYVRQALASALGGG